MKDWKEYRIKDLGEVITGNTPPTSNREYYGTEYKFIKPTDMVEGQRFVPTTEEYYSELAYQKYKKCLLPPKTPCVVTIGSLGKKMCLTDTECFTNQAVNAVIPNKQNDGEFLYYAFKASVLAYVKQLDSGTTSGRENVSKSSFSKIKVRVPSLPTQKKIASILSAYDNLIQNYKKQIEALQTAASELYKEWFVRFRFPGYQTTKFENGIPEGWKVGRLSNYCKITDGTHDTPLQVEEGIPLVTGKSVKKGEIDFSIPYNISIEDHEKIKKRSGLKTGDILFSNIGTVGNSCLVEYDREFSVKNMIIFKPETIEKSMYLYYLITSDSCQQLFSAQTNGSTQQFLGLDFMRNFKILVPENPIISEFGKKQEVIYAKIRNLRKQITNLTQQRDLLLPRLMSGKLEVE